MDTKTVLNRIISVRKSKGITQKEMAEHLGICNFNYLKVEKGTTELTIKRLFQISEYLKVEPESFLKPENDSIIEGTSPKVPTQMSDTILMIIENLSKGNEIEITQYSIKTTSQQKNQA